MRRTRWLLAALCTVAACEAAPKDGEPPDTSRRGPDTSRRDLEPSGFGGSSGTDAAKVKRIELNHLTEKRASWSETRTLDTPLSAEEAWQSIAVAPDEVVAAALRSDDGTIVDAQFVSKRCQYALSEEPRTHTVPTDYESIQAALDAAQAGDTVRVLGGTYREALRLKSGVRLIGSGAHETVLDGAGLGANLIEFSAARDAVVSGFTLRGVERTVEGPCGPEQPLTCSGNWYFSGIYADGHAFEDDDPCNDPSIYFSDNIVTENEIGMMLYFHPYAVVRDNVFVDNRVGFAANHHGGASALLVGNVFYANTDVALAISASFLDVVNNVFANNGSVLHQEYCQRGRMRCNVLWQNGGVGDREFSADEGNLSADPLLSSEDYSLDPSSPALHTICEGEPEPPPITSSNGCDPDP